MSRTLLLSFLLLIGAAAASVGGGPAVTEVINPDGWELPRVTRLTSTGSERRSYYDGSVLVSTLYYEYKATRTQPFYALYNRSYEQGALSRSRFEEQLVLYVRVHTLGTSADSVPLSVVVSYEPHDTFPWEELEDRRSGKKKGLPGNLGVAHIDCYYDRDGDGIVETCILYGSGISDDDLILHVLHQKGLSPSLQVNDEPDHRDDGE